MNSFLAPPKNQHSRRAAASWRCRVPPLTRSDLPQSGAPCGIGRHWPQLEEEEDSNEATPSPATLQCLGVTTQGGRTEQGSRWRGSGSRQQFDLRRSPDVVYAARTESRKGGGCVGLGLLSRHIRSHSAIVGALQWTALSGCDGSNESKVRRTRRGILPCHRHPPSPSPVSTESRFTVGATTTVMESVVTRRGWLWRHWEATSVRQEAHAAASDGGDGSEHAILGSVSKEQIGLNVAIHQSLDANARAAASLRGVQ